MKKLPANAVKKKFPAPEIQPMLATLVDTAFSEKGWVYEVKWDGYRALSYLNGKDVEIRSRNNKSFNEKFYPILSALKKWNKKIVVDGEVIVINSKGISDFGDLQNWRSEEDGQLIYYVFDILWSDGYDLMNLTLVERHEILKQVVPEKSDVIRISELFNTDGKDFFSVAENLGLEGIIAKKADSVYLPGSRSKEWLKIKTEKRQEAIVGGYTRNEGSSKKISALLLGLYEKGEFQFIGTVGTGFSNAVQDDIIKRLKPFQIKKCPFSEVPEYNKPSRFRPDPPKAEVNWVKPGLVVEISYRELTKDGSLRHPSFKGIREDKNANEVVREKEVKTKSVVENENAEIKKAIIPPGKRERKTLLNPADETQVRSINGHEIKFTNLSKVYWPKENITKRDMLNYYFQAAPFILPYLKDRPQTLYRHPNGILGEAFYQKDITGKAPAWVDSFPYFSEADDREKKFLVCKDEASVMYIASLGCIEMNPWSSKTETPDNPDWCIIDLDPDKNSFDQVVEAARVTKQILDEIKVKAFCKTSGSTGIHIYIPFGAKYSYEDSKEFGRKIAKLVTKELPRYTTIERTIRDRKGKMYIDFLQNRPQATVATAYSLRPKPGATVSMPLHWEEVKKGLKMTDYNIHNSIARIKEQGDIFKGVLGAGIDLPKAEKKLLALLS